jgi:hypothetical protein
MSNQPETSGAPKTSELSQGGTWKEKSAVPFQHITRPFVQTLETSPTVTFMPISGLGRLSKNGGLLSFAGSIQSPWSRYITPTDSLRGQEAA